MKLETISKAFVKSAMRDFFQSGEKELEFVHGSCNMFCEIMKELYGDDFVEGEFEVCKDDVLGSFTLNDIRYSIYGNVWEGNLIIS